MLPFSKTVNEVQYLISYSLLLDKPHTLQKPLGGILADEMGLGKTVEFLACMLLHDRPVEDTPLPERLATLNNMEVTIATDWTDIHIILFQFYCESKSI